MMGEDAGQTRQAQVSSEGLLGRPGQEPFENGLQPPSLEELLPHHGSTGGVWNLSGPCSALPLPRRLLEAVVARSVVLVVAVRTHWLTPEVRGGN